MLPLAHVGFTTTAVKLLAKSLKFNHIDYRLLIPASLLPDLLDKPIAGVFRGIYSYESRAVGHSFVFLGCLGLMLLIQYFFCRKQWLLPVFIGVACHDILDAMWLHPEIFWWPLYGWDFYVPSNEAWQGDFRLGQYKINQLDLLDNVSVLLLLYFLMNMALQKRIFRFFREGDL